MIGDEVSHFYLRLLYGKTAVAVSASLRVVCL
jgi:hypothetical protein